MKHLLELVRADLAATLDIQAEDIELIETEAVQWRDSSLGCPEPGMAYLQVITPGYRLTLKAQGQTYTYHTDSGQRVIRCKER